MLRASRSAMATLFEAWLVGDDEEQLAAVGQAVLDEVTRIEGLLSRFDPASEIARVNRQAAMHAVRVDYELFAILSDCRRRLDETGGYFDICASATHRDPGPDRRREKFELDPRNRSIRFLEVGAEIDLGGYGKGYALDAAARILDQFQIGSALLSGGTSSILARGLREDGRAWPVGIRNPFATAKGCYPNPFAGPNDDQELVTKVDLSDCGFSSSAVFETGAADSDLIDPLSRQLLTHPSACSVIAPTAVDAEVLSTALLAMGKASAIQFLTAGSPLSTSCRVAWIERRGAQAVCEWLK